MTKYPGKPIRTVSAAAVLLSGVIVLAPNAVADDPALAACIDAVGTFLTTNEGDGVETSPFVSRSLISLTNGGHAFLTDSGEAREPGFSPFSDGRGAWRCVSHTDSEQRIAATILDFTFPTAAEAEQRIGRLDIEASFDTNSRVLSGTMTLSFAPLDGNPMDAADLENSGTGQFTGIKIKAR